MNGTNAAIPAPSRLVMRVLSASLLIVTAALAAVSVHAEEHGPMGGGHGGPGMMMFGGPPQHVAHMVDRMLDGLGVTDAQRSQIRQIAMGAAADLHAQHEAGRGLHEKGAEIFTAPTVDASAAESLRQQMLAQHDQSSKREMQAMLDISRVLTPEQRARIGERMKERQAVMHDRMQRMEREHGDQRKAP